MEEHRCISYCAESNALSIVSHTSYMLTCLPDCRHACMCYRTMFAACHLRRICCRKCSTLRKKGRRISGRPCFKHARSAHVTCIVPHEYKHRTWHNATHHDAARHGATRHNTRRHDMTRRDTYTHTHRTCRKACKSTRHLAIQR